MRGWLAVINHAAGKAPVRVDRVASALAEAGVEADVASPSSVEETRRLIRDEVASGRRNFIAVGGDGTVNLIGNELLQLESDDAVLGVLPAGTGCDLLRTFGISQDIREAARHLATDQVYPIDALRLEGEFGVRYCINVSQVGVGAAAAETAPRLRRSLGPARYPMAFAARLPRFPRATVRVTTEKRTYESSALAVIMANAQFFAGGWNVAPKATLVDGVADIQIIDASKARAPALVPKIIKGTHLRDRAVRRFSSGSFRVETSVEWPLEVDGDFVGNTPLTGQVVRAALRLKI